MATDSPSTVVPLAYSLRSAARRAGCSQQEFLNRLAQQNVPVYLRDGQVRIPRGILTGYDCRYDTKEAWRATRRHG